MPNERVVLDADDMRRTLVRIAHEIVEKNADRGAGRASAHRRASTAAARSWPGACTSWCPSCWTADVPLGDLDISFYRDDVGRRAEAPTVHASHIDFHVDGATVVIVDDVLYTGRTVRAAIEALFDYGRPARVQLAVLADRGHRELPIRPDYVGKNLPTVARRARQRPRRGARRGRRGRRSTRRPREVAGMKHLLSIEDLDRAAIERILDRAARFAEVSDREIKKVPALRGRTVLNLFYEASHAHALAPSSSPPSA